MGAGALLGGHQAGPDFEGVQQGDVDIAGENEAGEKADHQGGGADDQTPAKLDQVVEQRRARGFDFGLVGAHDVALTGWLACAVSPDC